MSGRKNVFVTLGLTLSVSLLAAALAVLLFTFHYGHLQFDLLNAVCGEVVEQEPEQEGTYPNRFPSSGVALVISSYSPDQPYMSFGMQVEDSIIATEDGTVTTISSDDTYPYIIEIEHENGYQTRYMCNQEAQLNVQEGDQVTSGSELITITLENTQLDYQVFLEGEPIDPINIIDAKG